MQHLRWIFISFSLITKCFQNMFFYHFHQNRKIHSRSSKLWNATESHFWHVKKRLRSIWGSTGDFGAFWDNKTFTKGFQYTQVCFIISLPSIVFGGKLVKFACKRSFWVSDVREVSEASESWLNKISFHTIPILNQNENDVGYRKLKFWMWFLLTKKKLLCATISGVLKSGNNAVTGNNINQ